MKFPLLLISFLHLLSFIFSKECKSDEIKCDYDCCPGKAYLCVEDSYFKRCELQLNASFIPLAIPVLILIFIIALIIWYYAVVEKQEVIQRNDSGLPLISDTNDLSDLKAKMILERINATIIQRTFNSRTDFENHVRAFFVRKSTILEMWIFCLIISITPFVFTITNENSLLIIVSYLIEFISIAEFIFNVKLLIPHKYLLTINPTIHLLFCIYLGIFSFKLNDKRLLSRVLISCLYMTSSVFSYFNCCSGQLTIANNQDRTLLLIEYKEKRRGDSTNYGSYSVVTVYTDITKLSLPYPSNLIL